MAIHPIIAERKLEALRHALGDTILAALVEPAVVEILANPDGRLILDRSGEGRMDTGAILSAESRERVIRLIADYVGETVTRDDPRLSGVLPGTGERFQGMLPPVTSAPAFSIRKRPSVIWSLEDYVRDGAMTHQQASSSTSFRTPPSLSMISSIRSSGAAAPSSRVSETTNKGSWAGPARDPMPLPDWKQTSMLCGCPSSSTFVLHRISSPSSMSSHAPSTHRRHRSWPRQASLSMATWPRFGTARHALKKRAISRRGWLAT